MGRAAVYTTDSLLDHALELFSTGGTKAVTMAAVARAAGAPSGSVYHRFADQPTLLGEMWLRTVERFEADYLDVLGEQPDVASAVDAAAWTVTWCRTHPLDAALLHAGPRALAPEGWTGEAGDRIDAQARRRVAHVRAAVKGVAEASGRPADEVSFAMFDLPLAEVRTHLGAGRPIPPRAVDRVRRLASRILGATASG